MTAAFPPAGEPSRSWEDAWRTGPHITATERERQACSILPSEVYRYFAAGADEEISRDEAAGTWRSWRFLPRVLHDVSKVSTSVELLGTPLAAPVLVAPTALHTMAHADGEVATAVGAAQAGSLMILSSRSGRQIADVGAVAGPWWFQVYVLRDRSITLGQVARAVAAGARALVLTVDVPYALPRAGVHGALPAVGDGTPGNRPREWEQDPTLGPGAIAWLAEVSGLPVLVKGVLRVDDALVCVRAGAAGVIVSNHGGRQLDRAVGTAYALGPIAEAVGADVPVLVDGGVRSGSDVVTALALGARAVLIGRPALWALATGGADGVRDCLEEYRLDLARTMALAGIASIPAITPDLLTAVGLQNPHHAAAQRR